MKRILVATDGSAGAGRAVAVAGALAASLDAELTIVTVEQPSDEGVRELVEVDTTRLGDAMEATSEAILAAAREASGNAGAKTIKGHISRGDPAESILHLANGIRADFVVVGRRGRSRLEGLLFGSVSQKLATLAPCPVLVVP